MLQTNIREIDADMDVDQVADYIKQHGATAWLQSVGGILANYPTNLDFQVRNPHLANRTSGDLVADSLDAARARNMRLLGRMDFSKVQRGVAEAHPDWLYVSPNGTWQTHTNGLVSVCPSGEWYQRRSFDILDEVMGRYDLDGFFVNWAGMNENDYYRVYHGVCHCQSCRSRWEEYSGGKDLPDGPWNETYDEWKVFSDGVVDEWTGRVRDFISERLPDAGLILGESADIMFHEANNAVDREMWHFATAETVSKAMSYRPDVPVLVNAASFLDHAYRMASEQPDNFAQYYLQAIARGANPSTYIIGTPGKIPWAGMDKATDLMRFHDKHKDVYSGFRPIARTGLVLPDDSLMEDEQYEEATVEYKGLYMALQELHIPFDVVAQEYLDEIMDNGGLNRYGVLVLPHLGTLNATHASVLDEWVESGGTLVTSGAIGVEEGGALQLQSLPATRQKEYISDEEDNWSTYLAPEQNRTEEHYYTGPLVPLLDDFGSYEWKDGSRGVYKKLAFGPFAPPEYIYGNVQVGIRGAGIGAHGKGIGVLVPFPVGKSYREIGLSVFRDFFSLVLGKAGGAQEKLEFDLVPQAEVILGVNGAGQTVVHVINQSGIKHQNYGTPLPLPAGRVRVVGNNEVKARTLVTNEELEIDDEGWLRLPGIELFDVVIIEGL